MLIGPTRVSSRSAPNTRDALTQCCTPPTIALKAPSMIRGWIQAERRGKIRFTIRPIAVEKKSIVEIAIAGENCCTGSGV